MACEAGAVARRCWLVRADQGDALAGVFESTGTVALGGAPGPADLTGLGQDEIVELIRPTHGREDEDERPDPTPPPPGGRSVHGA